jgi:hypothetical protein
VIKLIVAGSRTATDYKQTHDAIVDIIHDNLICCEAQELVLISGNARGPDSHAIRFGEEHDFKVEIYPAEWDKYGKSAGYKRNELMAEKATHLLAIWDGESKGTKHMIDIAKKLNIPTTIINSRKETK